VLAAGESPCMIYIHTLMAIQYVVYSSKLYTSYVYNIILYIYIHIMDVTRCKNGFDELKWFRKHLLEIEMTKKQEKNIIKKKMYILIHILLYYCT